MASKRVRSRLEFQGWPLIQKYICSLASYKSDLVWNLTFDFVSTKHSNFLERLELKLQCLLNYYAQGWLSAFNITYLASLKGLISLSRGLQ
jgi:hypothetical protein